MEPNSRRENLLVALLPASAVALIIGLLEGWKAGLVGFLLALGILLLLDRLFPKEQK